MNAGMQNIMISLGAMQSMLFLSLEWSVHLSFRTSCPQDPVRRPSRSQLCPSWLRSQPGYHHRHIPFCLLQGLLYLAFLLVILGAN